MALRNAAHAVRPELPRRLMRRTALVAGPAPGPDGPTAWLALLHERLATFRPPPPLSWKVDRPDGEPWTVQLVASAHGERREAMSGLLRLMAATLGGLGLLLWLMSLQVRQTVQPLRTLLEAIGRLDDRDRSAVRSLPPMRLPELQTLATWPVCCAGWPVASRGCCRTTSLLRRRHPRPRRRIWR
ncbi:MAG: hypothetical protein ACKVQR_20155 [Aquabacterium sp.]